MVWLPMYFAKLPPRAVNFWSMLVGVLEAPIDPADPLRFSPPLDKQIEHWWPWVLDTLQRVRTRPRWYVRDAYCGRIERIIESEAVLRQRRVRFRYYSIQRDVEYDVEVDPYGLGFAGQAWKGIALGGAWYMVGLSHLRNDQRVFKVLRIRSEVEDFAVEASGGRLLRARAMILDVESKEGRARLIAAFGAESLFQVRDPLWAPVESRVPGIFLTNSTMAGWAAVARAVGLLSRGRVQTQPPVARVDGARCRGCGDCVTVCPFGALRLVGQDGLTVAQVSEVLCQGCGTCLAHCPTGAIIAGSSSDRQIEAMLEVMLA